MRRIDPTYLGFVLFFTFIVVWVVLITIKSKGAEYDFNIVTIGKKNTDNKSFCIDKGTANNPCLRYNATLNSWEFSNDGETYATFGSSASVHRSNLPLPPFTLLKDTEGSTADNTHTITEAGDYILQVGANSGKTTINLPTSLADNNYIKITRVGGAKYDGRQVVVNSSGYTVWYQYYLAVSRSLNLWRNGATVTYFKRGGTYYDLKVIDQRATAFIKMEMEAGNVVREPSEFLVGQESWRYFKHNANTYTNAYSLGERIGPACLDSGVSFTKGLSDFPFGRTLTTSSLNALQNVPTPCSADKTAFSFRFLVEFSGYYKICFDGFTFEKKDDATITPQDVTNNTINQLTVIGSSQLSSSQLLLSMRLGAGSIGGNSNRDFWNGGITGGARTINHIGNCHIYYFLKGGAASDSFFQVAPLLDIVRGGKEHYKRTDNHSAPYLSVKRIL